MRAALERIFLDSPISRLGAYAATLVGLAIGVPLSVGRIEVHDGLIVCRGLPKFAFRRGGTCVGH
ncbi:MAG: Fe-S oxidoreductase, partial [Pseudoclavibacter sp.]